MWAVALSLARSIIVYRVVRVRLCHPCGGQGPGVIIRRHLYLGSSNMTQYYVYIMASGRNGTLYIGVTSDLIKRVWHHKEHLIKSFTSKYNVTQLVYYEIHGDIMEAIKREKNLKVWKREWKIRIIEESNSEWKDLYEEIMSPA
jgi:putative endonuclease